MPWRRARCRGGLCAWIVLRDWITMKAAGDISTNACLAKPRALAPPAPNSVSNEERSACALLQSAGASGLNRPEADSQRQGRSGQQCGSSRPSRSGLPVPRSRNGQRGKGDAVHGRRSAAHRRARNAASPGATAVTRLSRKVLAGLGLVVGVGLDGALIYALQTRNAGKPEDLITTDSRAVADGLAGLPRDYTGPILGPPLLGDLGRPILNVGVQPPAIATPDLGLSAETRAAGSRIRADRQAVRADRNPPCDLWRSRDGAGEPSRTAHAGSHRPRPRPTAIDANSRGSTECIPQLDLGQAHRLNGSRRCAGIALCVAGRRRHLSRTDRRHSLGPPRPDYRAGHREPLRQPDRAFPRRPTGHAHHRAIQQTMSVSDSGASCSCGTA